MVKDITAQKSNDSERGFTLITPKYETFFLSIPQIIIFFCLFLFFNNFFYLLHSGQTSFLCASVGETAQWIKFITASHEKCVKSARTPYVSRFLGEFKHCFTD